MMSSLVQKKLIDVDLCVCIRDVFHVFYVGA